MIKVGDTVKVEDIGPLAVCLDVRRNEVELELEGERFWIAKRYCKAVS